MKIKSLILAFVILLSFSPEAMAKSDLDYTESESWYASFDYSDPNWITDEEFFGKWDSENNEWEKEPYLNYEKYDALSEAETMVKAGNYTDAKELITEYYKNKFQRQPRTITASDNPTTILTAQLECYNVFTQSSVPLDIVDFTPNYTTIRADITSIVAGATSSTGKNRTFEIVALERDGYEVVINSRESGRNTPYVEAEVNGQVMRFDVKTDYYLRDGDYKAQNFGLEENLYVKEDFDDSNTMRARLNFEFDGLVEGDNVTSATLYMNGKSNKEHGTKKVIVTYNSDGEGEERGATWENSSRHLCTYNGEDGPLVVLKNSSSSVLQPVENYEALYTVYRQTGEEAYAYNCFRLYNNFIRKYGQKPVAARMLDLGTRAQEMPIALAHLSTSEHFNAENFIPMLKYAWTMANGLVELWNEQAETTNWGLYETAGLANIAINFKEFTDVDKPLKNGGYGEGKRGGWTEVVQHRYVLLSGTLIRDDESFSESLGYGKECITLYKKYMEFSDEAGEPYELKDELRNNLLYFGRYMMNATGPDFCDFQIGDSYHYTTSFRSTIKSLADITGDAVLTWAGSNGKYGTAPNYTSILYPDNRKALMKTGWGDKDIYIDFTSDAGISAHNHADDLQLVMFAYGQYLLSDQKQYNYMLNDPMRAWLYSTKGHNTVSVNHLAHKQYISSIYSSPIMGPDGEILQFNRLQYVGAGNIERYEMNDGYDYVRMETPNYLDYVIDGKKLADVDYTRSVLFTKNSKYVIVTDYLTAMDDSLNNYVQNWHMLPEANISMDNETKIAKSNFAGANIQVVPVLQSGEMISKLTDGFYSPKNSFFEKTKYATYEKNVKGNTTFNTVLLPTKAGDVIDASTEQITLDVPEETASAFTFSMTDTAFDQTTTSSYYALHNPLYKSQRKFGNYSTDGSLGFAEKNQNGYTQLIVQDATNLISLEDASVLLKSKDELPELSVVYDGSAIHLSTTKDINLKNLTVRSNKETTSVTLNGEKISFNQSGGYVYFGETPIIENGDKPEEIPEEIPSQPSTGPHGGGSGGSGGGGLSLPDNPPVNPGGEENKKSDAFSAELKGHWGETEIKLLIDEGIVVGDDNGKLDLTRDITRAEFTTLLVRAMGAPLIQYSGEFADVDKNDWYADYIATAKANKIFDGADGFALPNDIITREQMAKLVVCTYLTMKPDANLDLSENAYLDKNDISDWAIQWVNTATNLGLLHGMETGKFMPKGNVLREQAFAAVGRLKMP